MRMHRCAEGSHGFGLACALTQAVAQRLCGWVGKGRRPVAVTVMIGWLARPDTPPVFYCQKRLLVRAERGRHSGRMLATSTIHG